MNKEIRFLSPFKRMCVTIGNLPTAYIESMSYYEALTYLVNYLCNNVIPVVNDNGKAVEELQAKYLELVDYVNNYFTNLDVQEEINNKLDDMAEQGELAQIILEYLQMNGLIMFDNVVSLNDAENLLEGSFVKTLGRYAYNDGYGAFYKVRALEESDVIDEYNIVSLTNYPTLIAEKIKDSTIENIQSDITTISDNITTISDNITTINNNVGNLSNLDTTDKTSLVNAINEVKTDSDNNIGNLSNLDTTDKTNLVNAINEVKTDLDNKEYPLYDDHVRLYIDGVNGDDNNDGTTPETAFKTLDRFLKLLNNTKADIRCYIISAGTYKFLKPTISDAIIHITGTVSGVILSTDLDELVFYGGHMNFNNVTFDLPEGTSHYYDGVLVTFDDVIYKNPVRIYGGSIDSQNCTYSQLRLSWTNAILDNTTIDNSPKTLDAIHCDSSTTLSIYNGLTVKHISEPTTYGVISLFRSTCFVLDTITNQTNSGDYAYGFRNNYCVLGTNNTTFNAVKAIGTSNQLDHSLVFTNSQDLPVA